jgi:citrate synthase
MMQVPPMQIDHLTMQDNWLSAHEAALRLKVSTQTLYSYVSRGLLRSKPVEGSRSKHYRRSDVDKLVLRQSARNPKGAAQASLNWGLPVLNSSLTCIKDGNLFYCGESATQVSEKLSLEQLAAKLWGCALSDIEKTKVEGERATESSQLQPFSMQKPTPQRSFNAFMTLIAEPIKSNQQSFTIANQGLRLLNCMRLATTLIQLPQELAPEPMHRQLQAIWQLDESAGQMIRKALILCADHELNVSSFTARCVASSGADLDACVVAGLAALTGAKHGGIPAIIEDHWDSWMVTAKNTISNRPTDEALALAFGHPIYPNGDPRAQALLTALPPDPRREKFLDLIYESTGLLPSLDFALVAIRRQLNLPLGSAFALFAIGRVVGWIAHVLEQRAQGSLIRPRAEYIGKMP